MAHKILGIDLGTHTVKVVVASAGLRKDTILDILTAPTPTGEGPVEERAAFAAVELIRQRGLSLGLPFAALAGDTLSMRVLEFGFTGLKRADLAKAVGSELEGQLPHDLDEIVYDFDVVPRISDLALELAQDPKAEPVTTDAAAAAAPQGTTVLTAATTRERVRRALAVLGQHGLEPRALVAAPATYVRAASRIAALESEGDPVMVIDCGHTRTNVCVIRRGRAIFTRTLSRGGRHVTVAISRAWNLSFEDAERAKHTDGFIESATEPASSESWERISEVVMQELGPLVRDLRQTAAACRAQTGWAPKRGLLCGGAGRLRGMTSYLAEELGFPVGQIVAEDAPRIIGAAAAARGEAADTALLACGIALEAATGRPAFDLRKGEFTYRADFSFLRAKAGTLIGAGLAVAILLAINAYAALYKLRNEERALVDRLSQETTELFGHSLTPEEVAEEIAPQMQQSPFPKMTAFEQLVEISRKLPARDKVKLDIHEIDIRKDKITVPKATTDSRLAIDEIEKGLRDIECFADVTGGKASAGTGNEVQFALTITSKCM